jgi:hypothetical protein
MMRLRVLQLAIVALLAPAARGQSAGALREPIVFQRDTRERWLYGQQRAAFTPMTEDARRVSIVGISDAANGNGRVFDFTFPTQFGKPDTARMVTDARGHVLTVQGAFQPPHRPGVVDAATELRWKIFNGVYSRFPALPETRVWDLVPALSTAPLRAGARWTDTLHLSAVLGEYRQVLTGVRTSVVVGDTLVAGVRLWIVRDSAAVSYEERFMIEEITLDTLATVQRSAEGTIVGWYLLDPDLALFRFRADTTSLTGEAWLRYPDGRHFRTPARFERTMRIDMLDHAKEAALAHQRDSVFAGFSIVTRPEGTDERLARGDTQVVDALLDTVARSDNPDARQRAWLALRRWAQDPSTCRRMWTAMLTAGDTATLLTEPPDGWSTRGHQIDANDLALALPVMADPGVAFAFGIDRDLLYADTRQELLQHPPAIVADTTLWPCTPEACRMLAAQWTAPGDQRLRDLALIAHLTLDPMRWSDTVLARSGRGDRFLDPASTLIRGVATPWSAGAQAPLPDAGSSWHTWSNWMDGRSPSYQSTGQGQLVRFGDTHAVAIRFAAARTGRDFGVEWRHGMLQATNDTARLVFGAMLTALGGTPDEPTVVAEYLRSASPLLRELGRRELVGLFAHGAPPADAATATDVQNQLLAIAIDGAAVWPCLDSTMSAYAAQAVPQGIQKAVDHAYGSPYPAPGPLVVYDDNLGEPTRSSVTQRGIRMVHRPWNPPSNESAVILDLSGEQMVGPFVRVEVTQTHLAARVNGRGQSWAAGATLYLVRTGAGWRIATYDSWIT